MKWILIEELRSRKLGMLPKLGYTRIDIEQCYLVSSTTIEELRLQQRKTLSGDTYQWLSMVLGLKQATTVRVSRKRRKGSQNAI